MYTHANGSNISYGLILTVTIRDKHRSEQSQLVTVNFIPDQSHFVTVYVIT